MRVRGGAAEERLPAVWMIPQTTRTPPTTAIPIVLFVPRRAIVPEMPPTMKIAPMMMFHMAGTPYKAAWGRSQLLNSKTA